MKIIAKIVGWMLTILAGGMWILGLAGTYMSGGLMAISELLNPFNVTNWTVTFLTFAPGLILIIWADK